MSSTRFFAILAIAKMVSGDGHGGHDTDSTSTIGGNDAGSTSTKGGNDAGSTSTTTSAAAAAKVLQANAAMFNQDFYNYIFIVCASLVAFMFVWRVGMESIKYVRTLTCLNNDTQTYFTRPSEKWASFKRHVLYAPIFSKRHNADIKLSSAINVGTLPTRFQLFVLSGYFATNIAFCVTSIAWNQPLATYAKELRNRTGILAVVNMVPLFIMSSRNNLLIKPLNLSFDTFNLLHRWFGRIVAIEAITHMAAWMASKVAAGGWAAVQKGIKDSPMIIYGVVATAAFVAIMIQASSPIRHAFYETFKYLHIALVIVVVIGIWYHLQLANLPQLPLIYGCIAIWVAERFVFRAFRLIRRNGFGGSRAVVEALPGDACRVTVEMKRPWTFKAGQHAYVYLPSISGIASHPFSVAWSEEDQDTSEDKLAMNRQDILSMQKTKMSFIIRQRTGMTKSLFKKASDSPDQRLNIKMYVEGPYGGAHAMHSYGTVMLFAGGVGITHQVPHVRDLVAGHANGSVAARKIILVWIIQSPEHLEWIRPWMTSILAMDGRRDCLRIMLWVTRPRNTKEIHSPSATVQMFPGRPNIGTLLDSEMRSQVGAMGVSVCGGGPLSDDVRLMVRQRQHEANIDFVEEAFSW